MDLTNMIPGGAGEEKIPQQQLSKEEMSHEKTAEGRSMGRGRCPGTGGVPKTGIL